MSKEYTGAIYTNPDDMCKTYELARLINHDLTLDGYKKALYYTTSVSNYRQYVLLFNDKPVSFVGTQDKLVMGVAPNRCVELVNVATSPEHKGEATEKLFSWVERVLALEGVTTLHIRSQIKNDCATKCYEKQGYTKGVSHAWVKKLESTGDLRAKL